MFMHSNPRSSHFAAAIVALGAAMCACRAGAAELRLLSECRPGGALVRLGDVADIRADGAETETLAGIELFPTPGEGARRVIRARELLDLLALRGVNLAEHRVTGASRSEVLGPERSATDVNVSASVSMVRRVSNNVEWAIVESLRRRVSADESWSATATLTDAQIRALAPVGRRIAIEGGQAPWTGRQQFVVVVDQGRYPITAEVTLPEAVVVAARGLPRGSLVHESDVRMERAAPDRLQNGAFTRLEDVLGSEVVRPIVAGQAISPEAIHAPLLVRRGEVVTVYARSDGLNVRTNARSVDEGSRGDVITVESLLTREKFFARVTAPQEAEVLAAGVTAADDRVAAGSGTRNRKGVR